MSRRSQRRIMAGNSIGLELRKNSFKFSFIRTRDVKRRASLDRFSKQKSLVVSPTKKLTECLLMKVLFAKPINSTFF